MNREHLQLLQHQALSEPSDTAGLQLKTRALEALITRLDVAASPQALDAARTELLEVLRLAEWLGTARSQQCALVAGRLLSDLDEEQPESLESQELSYEQRYQELELHAVFQMQGVMGWQIDLPKGAMDWLVEQAETVLGAADPFAAFDRWVSNPSTPPADLSKVSAPADDGTT